MTSKFDPRSIEKFVTDLPNLLTPGLFIDARSGGNYHIGIENGEHDFGLGDAVSTATTQTYGYHSLVDPFAEPSEANSSAPLWEGLGLNYLGPTFVVQENTSITIHWYNNLGTSHILPLDETPHGAHDSSAGSVHVQPHLHGGLVSADNDGNPWNDEAQGDDGQRETPDYETSYSNEQSAGTIWYHDHALGITRLNVYAGLAGFYLIRDEWDTGKAGNPLDLPFSDYTYLQDEEDEEVFVGYEMPIVIQDKTFYDDGSLYLPARSGDELPFKQGELQNPPAFGDEAPSIVAEYGGDVMIVNGVAWPKLDLEPRSYRFRLLNGSDSRFYGLTLAAEEEKASRKVPEFHVIGSDGGLLDGPAVATDFLPVAPGERYDVILDFSGLEGQSFTLRNNGTGLGSRPVPNDAQTSGQIMRFNVLGVEPTVADPETPQWQEDLRPDEEIPVWSWHTDGRWFIDADDNGQWDEGEPISTSPGEHALAVFEGLDNYARLLPHLGTVEEGSLLWEMDPTESDPHPYTDPVTGLSGPLYDDFDGPAAAAAETAVAGDWTLFEVYNTTPDQHPIHLHGTTFMLLERQKIKFDLSPKFMQNPDDEVYQGWEFVDTNGDGNRRDDIKLQGNAIPAEAWESGFKDTAIINPGERLVLVANFADEFPAGEDDPIGRYVWHCHILSHEDHEMMRPLLVEEAVA
jgi:spore coat protein A